MENTFTDSIVKPAFASLESLGYAVVATAEVMPDAGVRDTLLRKLISCEIRDFEAERIVGRCA